MTIDGRNMKRPKTSLPLISVVTPSFNQGAFIRETIDSVLNQDYPNIEYHVIDGGSTDNTIEVLKSYGERVRWISEPDRNTEDAVIKGFSRSSGDILASLASDDVYEKGALRKVAEIFAADPEVAMVYGRCHYIDTKSYIIGECPTESFDYDHLAVYNFIAQPSAFFRRSAYEEVGGISLDLLQASDYDLWIRLTKNRKVIYLPEFLSGYRLHYAAKTLGFHDPCAKFEEYIKLTMKYYGWAPANRVYPCCLYRLKAKGENISPLLLKTSAFFFALYEYLRLNKRIDRRDLALIPRNLKKLIFGWELEDLVKVPDENT